MAGGGPGGCRTLAPPLEAGRRGSAIYRMPCFPACNPFALLRSEYSALIPLLQRQVLCVDTTASTPSTLR